MGESTSLAPFKGEGLESFDPAEGPVESLQLVQPSWLVLLQSLGNHSVKYWFIASVIRWIGSSTSPLLGAWLAAEAGA